MKQRLVLLIATLCMCMNLSATVITFEVDGVKYKSQDLDKYSIRQGTPEVYIIGFTRSNITINEEVNYSTTVTCNYAKYSFSKWNVRGQVYSDANGIKKVTYLTINTEQVSLSYSDFKNLEYCDLTNLNATSIWRFKGLEHLKTVKLPDCLEEIGESAFEGCKALETLDLSNTSIKKIYDYTFKDCENLKNIKFPDCLEVFGWAVFLGCKELESIDLSHTKVKTLPYFEDEEDYEYLCSGYFKDASPFEGCEKLKTILLPATLEKIITTTFYGCNALESLDLSHTHVKRLPKWLFLGHEKLKTVLLPVSLEEIGEGAFAGCKALETLDLSNTSIKYLPDLGCENLKSIKLPDCLEEIEESAFVGCKALETLDLSNTNIKLLPYLGCENLKSIKLPDGLEGIGGYAFYGCKALESLDLSHTKIKILPCAEEDEEYDYDGYDDHWRVDDFYWWYMYYYPFGGCEKLKTILLPASLEKLAATTFCGCDAFEALDLSYTHVKKLPNYLFSGHEKLKKVLLPASLEEIGEGAFAGCKALESIDLSHTKIKMLPYVDEENYNEEYYYYWWYRDYAPFKGCEKLKTILLPASLEKFGCSAFNGCKALGDIDFSHTGVKKFILYAFDGCSNLGTLTLPERLEKLYVGGYEDTHIKKLIIPDYKDTLELSDDWWGSGSWTCDYLYVGRNLKTNDKKLGKIKCMEFNGEATDIPNKFMANNTTLETLIIGPEVDKIGASAFAGCTALRDVEMPVRYSAHRAREIGSAAFTGCTSLERLNLCDRIAKIGKAAFAKCTSLNYIHLPNHLKLIDDGAFAGCKSLKTITLPVELKEIKKGAFAKCKHLWYVEMGSELDSIYAGAFIKCPALRTIKVFAETPPGAASFVDPSVYYTASLDYPIKSESDYMHAKTWENFFKPQPRYMDVWVKSDDWHGKPYINNQQTRTATVERGKDVAFRIVPAEGYGISKVYYEVRKKFGEEYDGQFEYVEELKPEFEFEDIFDEDDFDDYEIWWEIYELLAYDTDYFEPEDKETDDAYFHDITNMFTDGATCVFEKWREVIRLHVEFATLEALGISTEEAASNDVQYFTIDGTKTKTLNKPGVYIIYDGKSAKKVMKR